MFAVEDEQEEGDRYEPGEVVEVCVHVHHPQMKSYEDGTVGSNCSAIQKGMMGWKSCYHMVVHYWVVGMH